MLPSSHCSPASRTPLPHVPLARVWHAASQVAEPGGSHCSPGSTVPLPQLASVQTPLRHAAPQQPVPPPVAIIPLPSVHPPALRVASPGRVAVGYDDWTGAGLNKSQFGRAGEIDRLGLFRGSVVSLNDADGGGRCQGPEGPCPAAALTLAQERQAVAEEAVAEEVGRHWSRPQIR